ncbi:Maf family protein [soil metagenome]
MNMAAATCGGSGCGCLVRAEGAPEEARVTRGDRRERGKLVLASQSPRRQELLRGAGFEFAVELPPMDDGHLAQGAVSVEDWVTSLAYLKARAVLRALRARGVTGVLVVLGADTVVAAEERVLGKPADEMDAARMLGTLAGKTHRVITGIAALRSTDDGTVERVLEHEGAEVSLGVLASAMIDAHVRAGGWRGKAGGYNLGEVRSAGWPVTVVGDETTVVGLPVERVKRVLSTLL